MIRFFASNPRLLRAAVLLSLLAAAEAGLWALLPYRPRAVLPDDKIDVLGFSGDGRTLLTSDRYVQNGEYSVRLWDVATGQERAVVSTEPHLCHLRLSFDRFALADRTGELSIREAATGAERARLQTGPVREYHFSPDGGRVLTKQSLDDSWSLWHVDTKQVRGHFPEPSLRFSSGFDGYWWERTPFSPDGRTLAFDNSPSPEEPTVGLWDVHHARQHATIAGKYHSLAFAPDSNTVALALGSGVCLYDTTTGIVRRIIKPVRGIEVVKIAFTPDGLSLLTHNHVACVGEEGPSFCSVIQLWDPATGAERFRFDPERGHLLVQFSPDSKYLAMEHRSWTKREIDAAWHASNVSVCPDDTEWDVKLWDPSTAPPRLLWIATSFSLMTPDEQLLHRIGDDSHRPTLFSSRTQGEQPWVAGFSPDGSTVDLLCRPIYHPSGLERQVASWTKADRKGGDTVRRVLRRVDSATGRIITAVEVQQDWWLAADGKTLATCVPRVVVQSGDDAPIELWDVPPRKPLAWLLVPPLLFAVLWALRRGWRRVWRRRAAVSSPLPGA